MEPSPSTDKIKQELLPQIDSSSNQITPEDEQALMEKIQHYAINEMIRANMSTDKIKQFTNSLEVKQAEAQTEASETPQNAEPENDDEFFDCILDSLINEERKEFLDPLSNKIMINPVLISSGVVMDKTSAFNELGSLKFRVCPVTKKKLTNYVHSVDYLKKMINGWNKNRLEAAIKLAEQYKNDTDKFQRICDFANELIEQDGQSQYKNEQSRILQMQLGSDIIMNDPQRCGQIYIRLFKSMNMKEQREKFIKEDAQRVVKQIEDAIEKEEFDKANEWFQTAELMIKNKIPLDVLALRMKLAKVRNETKEDILESIKKSVFNLLNNDEVDEAAKLLDEWNLSEEEKSKFVIPLQMPKITAMSTGFNSGSYHIVTVNGQAYDPKLNANRHGRGIILYIIDHMTHQVEFAQTYDTHGSEDENDALYQKLKTIEDDKIVAMVISDEGTRNLKTPTRALIETFGSKRIEVVGYGWPWAFVGGKGSKVECQEMWNSDEPGRFSFLTT